MTTEQIIIELKHRLQECYDVAEANALARMVVEEVKATLNGERMMTRITVRGQGVA